MRISDWSSDVCSSDLAPPRRRRRRRRTTQARPPAAGGRRCPPAPAERSPGCRLARRAPYLNAQPLRTPSLANSLAAGQKPVKLDCSRFRPTNAVSRCHQGETKWPRARLARTIETAKEKLARSRFIDRKNVV